MILDNLQISADFISGLAWGALMYETLMKAARYYVIQYTDLELTNSQRLDFIDDGKLNRSIKEDE